MCRVDIFTPYFKVNIVYFSLLLVPGRGPIFRTPRGGFGQRAAIWESWPKLNLSKGFYMSFVEFLYKCTIWSSPVLQSICELLYSHPCLHKRLHCHYSPASLQEHQIHVSILFLCQVAPRIYRVHSHTPHILLRTHQNRVNAPWWQNDLKRHKPSSSPVLNDMMLKSNGYHVSIMSQVRNWQH